MRVPRASRVRLMGMRAALLLLLAAGSASASIQEPVIGGIAALPFLPDSGQFAADALAPDAPVIVNGVVGQAIVQDYLVVVSLEGPPNLALNGKVVPGFVRKLRLRVLEGDRPARAIVDVVTPLAAIRTNGQLKVPFLVRPSGCKPLRLIATIQGGTEPSSLERQLILVCQN